MTDVCGFRPFPGDGVYGHWTCGRSRFHRGAHRFKNYTIPRVPRLWHVRELLALMRHVIRWRRKFGGRIPGSPIRRVLYPTTYDPIPYAQSEES